MPTISKQLKDKYMTEQERKGHQALIFDYLFRLKKTKGKLKC